MQFDPSWDLFIIVFFAVIMAYSFIIGRDYTLKIIIATYIAILTADGVGNILQRYVLQGGEVGGDIVSITLPTQDNQSLVVAKISIFVIMIVLLSVKGRFKINIPREENAGMGFFMTLVFGLLSAGLLISTILVYASGGSFMEGTLELNNQMQAVYNNSQLVRIMIDGYSWWFSLPALAFVIASMFNNENDMPDISA